MSSEFSCDVRIFASKENWIEGNAISQLRGTAALPGMRAAIGLPDLHPGKGGPVGAAFVTNGTLYPHLIGNDIGCGMSLYRSDLQRRKVKLDAWSEKLPDLDRPWDGDIAAWLGDRHVTPTGDDVQLGTVGGGNHFAELQQWDTVSDAEAFTRLGFDAQSLVLLVHSGSRGLGTAIFRTARQKDSHDGFDADGDDGRAYLRAHDHAVTWAQASRALIAARFLNALRSDSALAVDLPHNFVERAADGTWVHRKGAAPSNRGAAIVPGSRGALSYLIESLDPRAESAWSLAHGAGRKWNRTDCRARLGRTYSPEDLSRTQFGGRVICEDRDLIYEEAPQVYKDVAVVVNDLVAAGLARIVATLKPLITYKTRRRIDAKEKEYRR